MSRPLFLVPSLDVSTLDGPEGHHAADVMRLRVGEEVLLGDGRGGLAAAVVRAVGRGRVDLSEVERWYAEPPAPRLVVAQGIAKGDRSELAVQAMTEVGVDGIVPWTAAVYMKFKELFPTVAHAVFRGASSMLEKKR